mgnify:FL=1
MYFREGHTYILPAIVTLCIFISIIVKPLQTMLIRNRTFRFTMIFSSVTGLLINYILKSHYEDLVGATLMLGVPHGVIMGTVVWLFFNPQRLQKHGWHDTDNKF